MLTQLKTPLSKPEKLEKPNKAPTSITLSHKPITENDAGAVVGTIKVADPDDNTATLSVDDKRFEVVTSGETMVLRLKAGQSLDYEVSPSVTLNITATDSAGNTLTKAFVIAVKDVAETPINNPPTAVSFLNAVSSLNENAAIGTGIKVADIAITDDALGTEALTLSGADAASFQIRNGSELYFVGASPNYEVKTSYAVTVNADDPTVGGNPDASQNFKLTINNINEAPSISAGAPSTELVESTSSSKGAATATVNLTPMDPDGSAPSYNLTGWTNEGGGTYSKDGTYGYVVLDTNTNVLTYHLDNARAATDALTSLTPPVTDSFTVGVTDGSLTGSTEVTFTIHGADDPAPPLTITKITEPVSGLPGSTQSFWSADGTKFFLQSTATLTADDNDLGGFDVFAYDVATGTKTLLSGSVASGFEGNSYVVGLSPDGTKVIIQTDSSLTADDTDGGNDDAFAYDLTTNGKTLLSSTVAGGTEGYSFFGGLSPDGSIAIIQSSSALSIADSDGGRDDVFAYDFATGTKTLLTKPVAGGVQGDAYFSGLSSDGTKAIILSDSTLTSDDNGLGQFDLFAYDFATTGITLISKSIAGGVEGQSRVAGWSPNGGTLIISSTSQLTATDPGSDFGVDLFAYNFGTGTSTLLTRTIAGGVEGDSSVAGWAAGGAKIIIGSAATLAAGDNDGGNFDLFAYDFGTGTTTLITATIGGGVEGTSYAAAFSPDGSKIFIVSDATLTVNDTTNIGPDLFAYDVATATMTLVAESGAGAMSRIVGWSADGSKAIIQSYAALTPDDTDSGNADLYAYDFATKGITLLTGSVAGGHDGNSDAVYVIPDKSVKWSADGSSLAVVTESTLALNDLDNGGPDLYWVNVTTKAATFVDLGITGVSDEQSWGEASSDGKVMLIGVSNPATGTDYYSVS